MLTFRWAMLVAFGLTGCGGQVVWTKPGATEAEFKLDRYQCRMQAKVANPEKDGGLVEIADTAISRAQDFRRCMDAHGYVVASDTPAGTLAAGEWPGGPHPSAAPGHTGGGPTVP